MTACFARTHCFFHLREEILLQHVGLKRGTGLARNDNKGLRQIDFVASCLHLRRIGRVDDVQRRKAGLLAKRYGENLRTKAGTAHTEQQDRLESSSFYI